MSRPRSAKNPAGVGGITNLPRKARPSPGLATIAASWKQGDAAFRGTNHPRAANAGRLAAAANDARDLANARAGKPTYAGVPVPPQSNIGKLVTDRAHQAHLDREHNLNVGSGGVGNPYHDRKGKFSSKGNAE